MLPGQRHPLLNRISQELTTSPNYVSDLQTAVHKIVFVHQRP